MKYDKLAQLHTVSLFYNYIIYFLVNFDNFVRQILNNRSMKKTVLIMVMSIFALACKPKQTVTNTKLDNKSERLIKGDWIISSVKYVGSDVFKITSFNIADSKCFEESLWTFVSNNNTGEMVLNKTNCAAFGSQITWFINKDGNFVMKFLSEGVKAKHMPSGYVLKVANQTERSFQLIDKATVGNNTAEIIYQFDKISN
jgi:hypothetical protein